MAGAEKVENCKDREKLKLTTPKQNPIGQKEKGKKKTKRRHFPSELRNLNIPCC